MKRIARTAKRAPETTRSRTRKTLSQSTPPVRVSHARAPLVSTHRSSSTAASTIHTWSVTSRLLAALLLLFFLISPVADAYADTTDVVIVDVPISDTSPIQEQSFSQDLSLIEDGHTEAVGDDVVNSDHTSEETSEVAVHEDSELVGNAAMSLSETSEGDASYNVTEDVSTGNAQNTDVSTSLDTDETVVREQSIDHEVPLKSTVEDAVEGGGSQQDSEDVLPPESTPVASTTGETTEHPVGEPDVTGTTTSIAPEPETLELPPEIVEEELPSAVTPTTTQIVVVTPTTTDTEVLPETSTHTTDADRFTFSETECVSVGNGAFHCVRAEPHDISGKPDGPVYALRDESGDMEIYVKSEEGDRVLTNNEYDDDAPSIDPVTNDIVWQALIDDRSQIMQYDANTGMTTRITNEAQNSMHPTIYDGDIVFQSWIGNDWEIVLIDKENGREIITDNTEHDIAPSITKDYIMWQAMEGTEWVGKILDRETNNIETVRGLDGGKVENPRMIVVFDSKKDNGDIETVGFDPETGEVVPLAVTPRPVPEQIPEPEPEQEEKALLHTTASTRSETKHASSTDDGSDDTNNEPESESIVVTPIATSTEHGVEETVDSVVVPTTPPEIVGETEVSTDVGSTTPTATATHIPDLVIPAFNAPTDEATTTDSV